MSDFRIALLCCFICGISLASGKLGSSLVDNISGDVVVKQVLEIPHVIATLKTAAQKLLELTMSLFYADARACEVLRCSFPSCHSNFVHR